jgi:phosphomevalonate kinase
VRFLLWFANAPAGGYDAVWFLALDDATVTSAVEGVWSAWTEMSVCPLSARQSDGGLRRESRAAPGLHAALERVWKEARQI